MANMNDFITLKFWYGGTFKKRGVGFEYLSGMCKTISVDPDKMSYFELEGIVKEDVGVKYDFSLWYHLPNALSFEERLKKVTDDACAVEMSKIAVETRALPVYVVNDKDDGLLMTQEAVSVSKGSKVWSTIGNRKKLTPKRASKTKDSAGPHIINKKLNNPPSDIYVEVGNQYIPLQTTNLSSKLDLVGDELEFDKLEPDISEDELDNDISAKLSEGDASEEDDSLDLDYELSHDEEDEDEISEELVLSEDLSFEEPEQVGDSVLKLGECSNTEVFSEYEGSDDEADDATGVHGRIDFRRFKWVVGQVFSTPLEFKEAVRKYAIHQGRNVKFCLSDNSKLNKLGVRCIEGCPFKLYASWDKTQASFIVKKVVGEHTCQRNMDSNRQFKSSWCADQLLDFYFKSRPHIPSAELVDIIRKEFRIIISRGFAYKIKYVAHRRLHGSMKQHYLKLMSYVGVLEQSNPNSHFSVVTDPSTNPPTFQRIFVCFEGVKDGWVSGCKKILCIDGCFLKTFLGGMLLSAVGRDPNEQMYPLAWAVVEGENNESWQWFISELKKCVPHDNGKEWIIISDEHPALGKWTGLLCPKIQKLLDGEKEEAAKCTVIPSTSTRFQVSHYMDVLEVDIEKKTCTCRKWDLRGIPCCHGVASIYYLRKEVESYVDLCYTKEAYLRAYEGNINPCIGERHWPKIDKPIDPPPIKIGPGRPRKNRIKGPHEDPKKPGKLSRHGIQMTCSICNKVGHNKRKCSEKGKAIEQPPPSKRSRGRPKKVVDVATTTPVLSHHNMSAQPSSLGKGNRTIRTGKGSRGGKSSSTSGRSGVTTTTRGKSKNPNEILSTQASTTNI